jgi:ABC-type multidrug transport system ATPase subunit
MNNIISIKNLTKSYGSRNAVSNLSFDIKEGEFFGFLGPNGAGKTTTIRMLTGIIKPNEGEILFQGQIQDGNENTSKYIGVLPESRGFYEWMTAKEYLEFFANLYDIKDIEKSVVGLLAQVGLTTRANSTIKTYSRGMKQRLGLARALINNPKVLFLDEPTLGLDPQGQDDIQKLLKNLNSQGVTIFYSSHLLNEVSDLCTRIGIINNGVLVAIGTIDEIKQKTHNDGQSLKELFLSLTKEKI